MIVINKDDNKAYEAHFIPIGLEMIQPKLVDVVTCFLGSIQCEKINTTVPTFLTTSSYKGDSYTSIFGVIKKLSMLTTFSVSNDEGVPEIHAEFGKNNKPLFRFDLDFTKSDSTKDWSVIANLAFDTGNFSIFLVNKDAERIYQLPFGNIYSSGKVCTGLSEYNATKLVLEGAVTAFARTMSVFYSNPWNDDLYSSNNFAKAILRFDKDGNWIGEIDEELLSNYIIGNARVHRAIKDVMDSYHNMKVPTDIGTPNPYANLSHYFHVRS